MVIELFKGESCASVSRRDGVTAGKRLSISRNPGSGSRHPVFWNGIEHFRRDAGAAGRGRAMPRDDPPPSTMRPFAWFTKVYPLPVVHSCRESPLKEITE